MHGDHTNVWQIPVLSNFHRRVGRASMSNSPFANRDGNALSSIQKCSLDKRLSSQTTPATEPEGKMTNLVVIATCSASPRRS